MRLEAKSLLYDIRAACERVVEFTAGKNFETYRQDAYCRSAVERQLLAETEE